MILCIWLLLNVIKSYHTWSHLLPPLRQTACPHILPLYIQKHSNVPYQKNKLRKIKKEKKFKKNKNINYIKNFKKNSTYLYLYLYMCTLLLLPCPWSLPHQRQSSISFPPIDCTGINSAVQSVKVRHSKPPYFAVHRGRQTGVFPTWTLANAQTTNFPNALLRKFISLEAAEAFVLDGTTPTDAVTSIISPMAKAKLVGVQHTLFLYTDGSCIGNQNVLTTSSPAGWGVAIVTEFTDLPTASPNASLVAQLYGPVVSAQREHGLPFATTEVGSNNTGELSAIAAALSWLLHTETAGTQAVICYDSQYAADSVLGAFNGKRNEKLIQHCRSLYLRVSLQRPLSMQHVKGHSNNRWNNLADQLANQGNSGQSHLSMAYIMDKTNIDTGITTSPGYPPQVPPAEDAPT